MKQKIAELKKEIEDGWKLWEDRFSNESKRYRAQFESYDDFYNNMEILEAKLEAYEDAQKIQDEKVEKLKENLNQHYWGKQEELDDIFDEIDKIFSDGGQD